MNLSIVITTYNRKHFLLKLLNQINTQKNNPYDITTIVVNDGSSDGTVEILKQDFPEVKVIHGDGNWWWTKSMNEGFKKAVELKAEFVLILNDDVEIDKLFLKNLHEDYKQLPEGSILGASSVSITKPRKIESAGTKRFIKWRLKFVPYFNGFIEVDDNFLGLHESWTLSGRGTLIPIEVFNKIGYYDEKLIQYGSDDEFVLRARLTGIPVFVSWNTYIFNNTYLTSKGSAFKRENIYLFIKSFFNPYSVNSIKKAAYLYLKYGYPVLLPIYLLLFLLGTFKSYFFNYQ